MSRVRAKFACFSLSQKASFSSETEELLFRILTRNHIMNTIKHMKKIGIFLFLSLKVLETSVRIKQRRNEVNYEFFNPKNQRKIAAVICILVIIAMLVPMVLGVVQ